MSKRKKFSLLSKDKAIRWNFHYSTKAKIKRRKFYVFLCPDCGIEVEIRDDYLAFSTGRCMKCKNKHKKGIPNLACRIRPYEARYKSLMHQVKLENPKCDITYEDYIEFTKMANCTYCDIPLNWHPHNCAIQKGHYLDRKDNSKGHLKDNITVCCGLCNKTKSNNFNYEEFLLIGKLIKQIRKNRNEA